jgi:hypothetical protein
VQHQQHDDHLDEMSLVDDNEELDLDLVPFIGPVTPNPNGENGDNFALLPDLNAHVVNQGAISMDISVAGPQVEISGASVTQSENTESVATLEIVLALAMELTNFLGLEIQPHEFEVLYTRDVPDMSQAAQVPELHGPVVGHEPHVGVISRSSTNHAPVAPPEGQNQDVSQQVGMVILPDNLDFDPGLMEVQKR